MAQVRTEWRSRADWYRSAYGPSIAESRLPSDAPLQLLQMRQPAGRFTGPATPDLSLALVLGGSGNVCGNFGVGRFQNPAKRGQFALTPRSVACDYQIDSPHEFLLLTIPGPLAHAALSEIAGGALTDHGPLHAAMQRDTEIESVVRRLWVEAAEGNPMGKLLAEDAAVSIAGRLTRLAAKASGTRKMPDDDAPPLHGARLARVMALIEDRLDADIRQEGLAEAAGLSRWHFCRAFKAATGVAPHRFVLLRRLARAQWLLRTTKLGLVEVALVCGFSSHAHLTSVFSREMGVAPSHWRRRMLL